MTPQYDLDPGEAQIEVELMKSGATRVVVRGRDGTFLDWVMENRERESLIQHLLLPSESIVSRRWWHRFINKPPQPLISPLEQ